MNCIPNAYTNLCTSTILSMVSGLETLKLPLYQDIIKDNSDSLSYFCIFPIQWGASSYLLTQSDVNGNIFFWSVNMQNQNILTADYETFNVIPAQIINYRSIIILKYKNKSYNFHFNVPFIDQLNNTKKVIQNLFNEDMKVFVLYDKIVFCFVRVEGDSFYRFVYSGVLKIGECHKNLYVFFKTNFDYSNGTLVALLDRKPYMLYNRFGLNSTNLYPFTNYVINPSQSGLTNYVVIGGLNNYSLEPDSIKPNLWKINYSFELQYQAPFFKTDSTWGYFPLQEMIPIPNTCNFIPPYTGPSFIMAFNNATLPTLAFLGNTQFFNTDNTINTFNIPIIYTSSPSSQAWDVYPSDGVIPPDPCNLQPYLYFVINPNEMIIYEPSLSIFLQNNEGSISIQDLIYSSKNNYCSIKVYPELYGTTKDYGNYNHTYKDSNYFFDLSNAHNIDCPLNKQKIDPSCKISINGSPDYLVEAGQPSSEDKWKTKTGHGIIHHRKRKGI